MIIFIATKGLCMVMVVVYAGDVMLDVMIIMIPFSTCILFYADYVHAYPIFLKLIYYYLTRAKGDISRVK